MFRTLLKCAIALVVLSVIVTAYAQQQTPAAAALAASASSTQSAPPAVAAQAASDADAARPLKSQLPVPHELSPWSMFLSADILVKIVMSGLALASLVTWTILLAKTFELSVAQRKLKGALKTIGNVRSLAEAQFALGQSRGVLSSLLDAAMHEARLSAGISGMGLLATIGSTSPFVGLFGTVWGIMNSFIGISKAQTTNLAVVAPGIAEALLATAIGLAAAIPAVIIYNHFARGTRTYLELVARASGASARLLSRDLDRGSAGVFARAAE